MLEVVIIGAVVIQIKQYGVGGSMLGEWDSGIVGWIECSFTRGGDLGEWDSGIVG